MVAKAWKETKSHTIVEWWKKSIWNLQSKTHIDQRYSFPENVKSLTLKL